jgi:hypothetical protein
MNGLDIIRYTKSPFVDYIQSKLVKFFIDECEDNEVEFNLYDDLKAKVNVAKGKVKNDYWSDFFLVMKEQERVNKCLTIYIELLKDCIDNNEPSLYHNRKYWYHHTVFILVLFIVLMVIWLILPLSLFVVAFILLGYVIYVSVILIIEICSDSL